MRAETPEPIADILTAIDERTTIPVDAIDQEAFMAITRYEAREEPNLTWSVYDIFTGRPARPSTWTLTDLTENEADVYCAIINAKNSSNPRDRI